MEVNKIIQGDCQEVLKTLPDNSIDAIVTDPPYGLSFMGKKWDYDVPSVEVWQECLRVLKPGGYLLSFAGTRTQHRMAVKIEDAGFEIRDMIAWVYGSGFPKSYNIAKGIEGKLTTGSCSWNDFHKLNGELGEAKSQGSNGLVKLNKEQGNRPQKYASHGTLKLEATTEQAKEWEGWGTALKPALEPITVARKPIEGTVAENCLKWGVGGINIDGCRVESGEEVLGRKEGTPTENVYDLGINKNKENRFIDNSTGLGRFPANLIHDGSDEVVELFPNTKSNIRTIPKNDLFKNNPKQYGCYGAYKPKQYETGHNDSGSASRFFYCAKASKSERNMGCEELEDKTGGCLDGNADMDNNRKIGARPDSKVALTKNNHPTVKPIALMEYLVKLVSKEGHLVLDPFAGSGSTLIACQNLRRNFIGIEREPDYIKIAESRLKIKQPTLL